MDAAWRELKTEHEVDPEVEEIEAEVACLARRRTTLAPVN